MAKTKGLDDLTKAQKAMTLEELQKEVVRLHQSLRLTRSDLKYERERITEVCDEADRLWGAIGNISPVFHEGFFRHNKVALRDKALEIGKFLRDAKPKLENYKADLAFAGKQYANLLQDFRAVVSGMVSSAHTALIVESRYFMPSERKEVAALFEGDSPLIFHGGPKQGERTADSVDGCSR